MSPPIKDPIPNQDINILFTKKDLSLTLYLAKLPPGFKSLINEAYYHNITEYYCNDSTDTFNNDKEDSLNSLKVIDNKDIDDE